MSAILVKDHQLDRSIESKEPESASSSASAPFEKDARIYEYALAANPVLTPMPVAVHDASLHEHGPTRVIVFDNSEKLEIDYPCSSPNLLAAFLKICPNESLSTDAIATSQAFYVIRGSGQSITEFGAIDWSEGDLFVVPAAEKTIVHTAATDSALYWINDEPLLKYLGVKPCTQRFQTTVFKRERMLAAVEEIRHAPGAEHKNRLGILLGNKTTADSTKTLTHTLWALLNTIPAGDAQRPHRHNSVALDLCVSAEVGDKVYTNMGPELGEDGWVKNPIKCVWKSGTVFSTPPGWW